ncbi:phospholipase D family protein [Pseudomonas plecoglossicida]|uniref:phospholipase D family protein n=1 Tax=Pseudomonas plecoglossicida TaxID=70775 RepID=UPI0015E3B3EC|nr:phospholipase D family protein [Pseudomonas plecoglossicida]MBA1322706.1 hypothetical protein [Pseudomonas plecoglossicida]
MRKLIMQGITPDSHGWVIEEMLSGIEVQRIVISVAFATSTGVRGISDFLAPFADRATVLVGIRNGVTTAQGIYSLAKLGLNLKVVDTGAVGCIFHPKLYYVQGESEVRLMVGSANLTAGGLWNNIEASYIDTLSYGNLEDSRIIESVINVFDDLHQSYPSNVLTVHSDVSLEELIADPRLVDERCVWNDPVSSGYGVPGASDPVPKMDLYCRPTSSNLPIKGVHGFASYSQTAQSLEYEIAWVSRPLTSRDLSMPLADTTNPTGSMGMKKGLLDEFIDHRHYFYDQVFNSLEWRASRTVGKLDAVARFHIVIKGVDRGQYFLTVNHDTRTNTTSYSQRNFMTQLHWGEVLPIIRDQDLLGRTLRLSRATTNSTEFLIEID